MAQILKNARFSLPEKYNFTLLIHQSFSMKKKRFRYLLIIVCVILLGILSRQFHFIPLYVGDVLYAVMIYFIVRLFSIRTRLLRSAVISLLICFFVELLQLYRATWIVELRNTPLGHYALGQGFRWSDLIAYAAGVAIAFLSDAVKLTFKR